jgi:hypothetical protein
MTHPFFPDNEPSDCTPNAAKTWDSSLPSETTLGWKQRMICFFSPPALRKNKLKDRRYRINEIFAFLIVSGRYQADIDLRKTIGGIIMQPFLYRKAIHG